MEMITVQLGEEGIRIGSHFWPSEYSALRSWGRKVFFRETSSNGYIPRSILSHCSSGVQESGFNGQPHDPRNAILSTTPDAHFGNYWGKGYNSPDGNELQNGILEAARSEVEDCDNFQGFQMIHHVGDGMGGGLGSTVAKKLVDEFGGSLVTFSMVPRYHTFSCDISWPYNAGLSMLTLDKCADAVVLFHEEPHHHMCYLDSNLSERKYDRKFAWFMGQCIAGVTTSFRFPSPNNGDIKGLTSSMVPLPEFNYLSLGMSSLYSEETTEQKNPQSSRELVHQMFDGMNWVTYPGSWKELQKARTLRFSANFRGNVSPEEVISELDNFQNREVSQIQAPDEEKNVPEKARPLRIPSPDSKATSLSFCPAPGYNRGLSSCSFLGNLTSVQHTFDTIFCRFDALYRRKTFMHFYEEYGVEAEMFLDAWAQLQDHRDDYGWAEGDEWDVMDGEGNEDPDE